MKKKHVLFQEKKNKPPFEIECLMDDMIDQVKINLIPFFKKQNIFHPISVDLRFDEKVEMLKDYKYIEENDNPNIGYHMLAFHKNTFKYKYGRYIKRLEDNIYLIRNRYRGLQVSKETHYIFQKKTRNKDNQLRQQLENILNGNIKIKKIKK